MSIQIVLQHLSDPVLPVQIQASKDRCFLIEVEGAEVILNPVLPNKPNNYFCMMTEIGNY